MSSPPSFWDLSKGIEELLNKGYFKDVLKLDVKSKTKSGVKFNFGGEEFLTAKEVVGFIEAQYEFKDHGVTFTENWNTDNVLITAIKLENWIKGMTSTCTTTLYPDKWPREDPSVSTAAVVPRNRVWNYGNKMLALEALCRNDIGCLTLGSVFSASKTPNLSEVGPVVKGSAVLNWNGFMAGCGIGMDVGARSMLECIVGLHYENDNMVINGFLTNVHILSGSFVQKFSDGDLEAGVIGRWSLGDTKTRELRLACKCKVDEDMALRFKLDNLKYFGFGLSQRLRRGVTVFLSFMANGMNFFDGNLYEDYHFGACLELGEDDEP